MNNVDLPPFPVPGARGLQVCEAVRFYLAIVNDLSFEQVSVLSQHVQTCPQCAAEFRMLQQATVLVANLPASIPSPHVDAAIRAALKAREEASRASVQLYTKNRKPSRARQPALRSWTTGLSLVAVLLLIVLAGIFLHGLLFPASSARAFQIPDSLSWNGYVLHYIQNETDSQGQSYQVEVYQDLGTSQMHIESTMSGQFDVVVVTDSQTMIGEDMMHHVAQTGDGAAPWAVDGSIFDLAQLRQNLDAHRISYLGTETFKGKEVYLVRVSASQVLLLDTHYLPVNVLQNFISTGTGNSPYTTFELMPTAQVSDSMWDMQVPSGFRMGQLPAKSSS